MFAVAHGFFDAGNGEIHGGLKGIGERHLFCDRPAEGACENIACPVELHIEIFAVIRTEFSGRAVVCHNSLTRAVGDYSGQNIKDYLSAIDEAKKEPYIDENRLGCVGASYGGYSVYYLAGHHDKRFKAFIAHCGIFDLKMQYNTTEEMWFANWDMGGAPWEKDNKIAQRTFANSPDLFVGNWDTPILVIHGQKDFRIDVSQGMAAFNAARMRGVPAQFLYFPNECHWVTGCQDGILWQRTFKAWLDKWLK